MPSLSIGIDTGGTFTDGVLLEMDRREILNTAKVLTTPHDLRICIRQIIERLAPEDSGAVRLVSLSTTLATNAIVEGKARPVGLFLLGYDRGLVQQYGFERELGTERFAYIRGGMNMDGAEQAPLDEAALAQQAQAWRGSVEAFAVSSYAGTRNAEHEERAARLLHTLTGLPVVQGHQLTSRLNSIRRATTASLNAGLLSTAVDFLNTVRDMLAERGIACPLIVVRGDGSLVSADFAEHRPVEIIHSGPATSALGGLYLSGVHDALVIDVGGTTTDLALAQNGHVLPGLGDAEVGGRQTAVRTIRARSFGLGGDSLIRFSPRGEITVGPERVIPLAYLGQQYPNAVRELRAWLAAPPDKFYAEKLETWILRREPKQPFADPRTNRVIELLRDRPRRLADLLKAVKAVSAVQVDGPLLLRQDIIARAGLTPTDLLHATGEYAPWDAEIARAAVDAVAVMRHETAEMFVQSARDRMTQMIVEETIRFLTGCAIPTRQDRESDPNALAGWLMEESRAQSNPFLGCQVALKVPIIGIGAPARAFLPPVAKALGVEIIFPEHYEVANAVGAAAGSVLVEKAAEVLPQVASGVVVGWLARVDEVSQCFESRDDALAFARETLTAAALAEAGAAGASLANVHVQEEETLGGMVFLRARAVGKPG